MQQVEPSLGAELSRAVVVRPGGEPAPDFVCDSGVHAPHPWGGLNEAFDLDDPPWLSDPWQSLNADYRRWQQARYLQLADEFQRLR